MSAPLPTIDFLPPDEPDELITRRLLTAYQKATAAGGAGPDGLWSGFASVYQQEFEGYLRAGDCSNVARVLAQMFRHPVTSGLALGADTYAMTMKDARPSAADWRHKAVYLGVGCGVLSAQCPEQGEYGTLENRDSLAVLLNVAERLGIDPIPPQAGAYFGARLAGKIVSINYLHHIYTAHRIKSILQRDSWDCLEIGGGVGFLAYSASQFGSRRFCIVDLPLVNVLQGYYLLKSSLASRVRLFGEESSSTSHEIQIVPNWFIEQLESKSFDIVVNQDSFPEMGDDTMRDYLNSVPRLSRGYFLSINQEARAASGETTRHGWVHDVCRQMPNFKQIYRAPYWTREGYVEELFRVTDG